MIRNFNIRDSDWDLSYLYHLIHSNILTDITDSFELQLFVLVQQILIKYVDNSNNSNSVIDLIFL